MVNEGQWSILCIFFLVCISTYITCVCLYHIQVLKQNKNGKEIKDLGREIMNRNKKGSSRTFECRFRLYFGIGPIVVEDLWNRLDPFATIKPWYRV